MPRLNSRKYSYRAETMINDIIESGAMLSILKDDGEYVAEIYGGDDVDYRSFTIRHPGVRYAAGRIRKPWYHALRGAYVNYVTARDGSGDDSQ